MTRILASALLFLLQVTFANANSLETKDTVASYSVPMTAEMVKRGDGSWVISKLSATEDLESKKAALKDHPDLETTLERYRRALSRGDIGQLASVWIMNPSERREMNRLADVENRVSFSISKASLAIDGDRATVSFMQGRTQSAPNAPRVRKLSRRGLAAHDAAGTWNHVTTR